ncbi:MAG: hypothetical protein EXR77_15555 [Myxococcales bacterium]|nr:hypothetical protein [Myxococcales bacterium]
MAVTADDFRWELGALLSGGRAVRAASQALAGKTVALLLSGGIAGYRGPGLCRVLRAAGARVFVFATPTALQFVTADALEGRTGSRLLRLRLYGAARRLARFACRVHQPAVHGGATSSAAPTIAS